MDVFRVALCDDEQIERELLEKYIQDWADQHCYPVTISSFPSGAKLLQALSANSYDLALLDIQMQAPDGMCVARKIRETDHGTGIFFITGYEDYLEEGYEVEAFRYLLKPSDGQKIPISRKMYHDLNHAFIRYFRKSF